MPVAIKGTGGGSVTLTAGAAAADTTLTLPNTSGTLLQSGTAVTVAQGGTGAATLTANAVLIGNGTSAVTAVSPTNTGNVLFTTDGSTWSATQKIVLGTTQASTSGTSIDFTSIPSWAKRATVMFNGVSTNGTNNLLVQIGAGSVTTSGYAGSAAYLLSTPSGSLFTAGFGILSSSPSNVISGQMILSTLGSNIWVCSYTIGATNNAQILFGGGNITLSGALDRVRITTAGGTDTFDAGSINIMYE
jgi:hypothetical protein